MSELYHPYHQAVERIVYRTLSEFGVCLIVDLHSFPQKALPYENAQLVRPQVCIGYDDAHVDESIVAGWQAVTTRAGLSVATNTPFAGSFVPLPFYRSTPRVCSLMVELRRDTYMDETTGQKHSAFGSTQHLMLDLFAVAVSHLTRIVEP